MTRLRLVLARLVGGMAVMARRLVEWWLPGSLKTTAKRSAALLGIGWFLGGILIAAPFLWWALLVAWAVAAWRVSDSSATPPPPPPAPLPDVHAGDTGRIARVEKSPEGVMCILHPEREEVNGE